MSSEPHPNQTHHERLICSLPKQWEDYFLRTRKEALVFEPCIVHVALARRVLVVAKTRVECAWAAYIDAVPGENHDRERLAVLAKGSKLPEVLARILFPVFEGVPYAGPGGKVMKDYARQRIVNREIPNRGEVLEREEEYDLSSEDYYEAMAYDEEEDYDEEEGCEDNWITLGLEPRGS